MKTCVMLLLMLCFSVVAMAQVVAIQCDSQMVVRVGVPNPMRIAVEGYPCSRLLVTMDSGKIEGESGVYTIIPRLPSSDLAIHVKVKTASGLKDVAVRHIRSECITVKNGYLLGKQGGPMALSDFRQAIAIVAPIMCSELDAKACVTGFTILISRDGKPIFRKDIFDWQGARIDKDDEIARMKASLKIGDKVKFTNVTYQGPDGPRCAGTLTPMEFTMVD